MAFKPLQRISRGVDRWLVARKLGLRQRALVWHYLGLLQETLGAVLPITVLLWVAMGAFFGVAPASPGEQVAGLLSATLGLVLFVDGLRIAIMPLGELAGSQLPARWPLPAVMGVALLLGVLVTYAEPAVQALRPLAELVDASRAPLLAYLMTDLHELLVLAIGLGVGAAAMLGMLRFHAGWPLKRLIAATLAPTLAAAAYLQWGNPQLRPLIGLAWDCGAVTTGPVTVPILLALGIGVMANKRQQAGAQRALQAAVTEDEGQALEGFGIVTLASLLPILAVQLLAIGLSLVTSPEDVHAKYSTAAAAAAADATSGSSTFSGQQQLEPPLSSSSRDLNMAQQQQAPGGNAAAPAGLRSPMREVVMAVRSIAPLAGFLLLLLAILLPHRLPSFSVYTLPESPPAAAVDGDDDSGADISGAGGDEALHDGPLARQHEPPGVGGGGTTTATAATASTSQTAPPPPTSHWPSVQPELVIAMKTQQGAADGEGQLPKQQQQEEEAPPPAIVPVCPADEGIGSGVAGSGGVTHAHNSNAKDLFGCMMVELADRKTTAGGGGKKQPDAAAAAAGEADGIPGLVVLPSSSVQQIAPRGPPSAGAVARAAAAARLWVRSAPAAAAAWLHHHGALLLGLAMTQLGMILFNIGLTYGFTALGNQAGSLLPGAFLLPPPPPPPPALLSQLPSEQQATIKTAAADAAAAGGRLSAACAPAAAAASDRFTAAAEAAAGAGTAAGDDVHYGFASGLALVMVVVLALGLLATLAEPALRVLGRTVQAMSAGQFSARALILAVATGVGVGMCLGSLKVLFFPSALIYIILAKYSLAASLTVAASQDYTAIAWDSAGVTTGPVTVPFVLSIGVGFSKAAQATEGFGILTAASVAPIVSVLACSLLQKPAAAVAGLARRSLTRLLDAVFASLRGETRAASSIAAAAPSVVGSSADDRDDGETEAHV